METEDLLHGGIGHVEKQSVKGKPNLESIEEILLDQTIMSSVKLEQKREGKSKPAKKRHGNTL